MPRRQQTTYIVHMNYNLKPSSFPTHHHWYSATLNSLTTTSSDSDSDSDSLLLYTYTTAYHGFAVSLTPSQAESLRRSDSVLGMYQDTLYSLHTTRTPEFLGLDPRLGPEARPHPTSTQPGLPRSRRGCSRQRGLARVNELRRLHHPVPSRIPPPLPLRPRRLPRHPLLPPHQQNPRNSSASTLNWASGPATPHFNSTRPPRKSSWLLSTPESKSLDDSLTPSQAESLPRSHSVLGVYQDTLYSLHTTSIPEFLGLDTQLGLWAGHTPLQLNQASQSQEVVVGVLDTGVWPESQSIFVSCLAGNSGPGKGSLVNLAPWIMMVGAGTGTIDRDFPAYAVMGDGKRFTGVSLYSGKGMGKKPIGLVYGTGKNSSSNLCLRGSLEPDVVRGKLVLCDRGINARVEKGLVVRDAGGVGMILANTAASGEELVADSHLLLAVAVGRKVGDLIRDYVRKDGATAVLSFDGKVLNVRSPAVVAAFSSRGPNMVTQQVLKPGVNILAGWSEAVGPTGLDQYIVHMNHNLKPSSFPTHHHWYSATLNSLTTTSSDSDSDSDSLLLYTYTTAYHGFAASLTPSQDESLRRSDSVLGVYQDTLYSLHTTRTPEFLGLDPRLGLWAGHTPLQLNQASQSQEVVVGVLDTGVWPESKSIFVSCLAGNSGPGKGSLVNVAPWIMTVGARTIDRDFPAYAVMGDGKRFTGVSLYSGKGMGKKPVGLVYITGKNSSSNLCLRGSLEPDVVRGKLVLCDGGINARVEKGLVVRDAGGVGMILANTAASGEELVADSHLLPAVTVGRKVGDLIRDYVRKDGATAVLSFDGKVLINVRPPAVVAAFSSRGPNMVTQQVLKPDVIEPGVIILAGWSEAVGPTGLDQYTRKIQFKFKSGLRRRPRTALKHQVVAVLPADARPLAIANLNATARGPQRGPGRASKQIMDPAASLMT
ncbi:hypothetical protein RHGRI_015866 [Rhododendron griersonianum]|uniref:SDD1 protein n=1 Tax=Rhododendron griersonianum TaxID=479676 RepID=A0AAV6JQH2_9ERIC|nr:hypothetical protein RHGRI_015866 [Rhododendron griersonianum]